jgi:hypothetical protein
MSPFLLFCKEARSRVLGAHPNERGKVQTFLGAEWRALTKEQQGKYKAQHAELVADWIAQGGRDTRKGWKKPSRGGDSDLDED